MTQVIAKLPRGFLKRKCREGDQKSAVERAHPSDCPFPIPPRYNFALNFGCTNLMLVAAVLILFQSLAPGGQDLWLIPCVVLLANLTEYAAHRWPMHHRLPGLSYLFQAHTLSHHRYFSKGGQAMRSSREAYKVVLSIPNVAGLLILVSALFALLWILIGQNTAAVVAMTLIVYFAVYEWLHLLFHAPARFRVHAWPVIGRLRSLHRAHHVAGREPCNFNLVFPLGDTLFATLRRKSGDVDALTDTAQPN